MSNTNTSEVSSAKLNNAFVYPNEQPRFCRNTPPTGWYTKVAETIKKNNGDDKKKIYDLSLDLCSKEKMKWCPMLPLLKPYLFWNKACPKMKFYCGVGKPFTWTWHKRPKDTGDLFSMPFPQVLLTALKKVGKGDTLKAFHQSSNSWIILINK